MTLEKETSDCTVSAKDQSETTSESVEPDFRLNSYRFDLPEERIAQSPVPGRADSRLMILRRNEERLEQARFADLVRYLPENCLLVANNSRVAPARVTGKRPGGGRVEFLLLTPLPLLAPLLAPLPVDEAGHGILEQRREEASLTGDLLKAQGSWQRAEAEGLLRPAKKFRVGDVLRFAPDFAVRVLERGEFGRCRVNLYWRGGLGEVLERHGSLPLPPYIRRPDKAEAAAASPDEGDWGTDADRYQTTYSRADKTGSVAAPTAGLHFTPELREALGRSGREWAEVTLYVGYGTFSPVRGADIREHRMHAEYAELPLRTLAAVLQAKAEGRPVIAVGTTSARVLEGVCELRPELFFPGREDLRAGGQGALEKNDSGETAFAGWTSIFLYPGRPLRVIDGLITNFHLPESSLLMLVSALAGRERVLRAYRRAVEDDFRFFSYGDAMLIL